MPDVCPKCGRPLCQERGNEWPNHAEYMRFRRKSAAIRKLCNACCKAPPRKGHKRCQACADASYARKRKAAVIHSKRCHCGKRACREVRGKFICLDHYQAYQEWERMQK